MLVRSPVRAWRGVSRQGTVPIHGPTASWLHRRDRLRHAGLSARLRIMLDTKQADLHHLLPETGWDLSHRHTGWESGLSSLDFTASTGLPSSCSPRVFHSLSAYREYTCGRLRSPFAAVEQEYVGERTNSRMIATVVPLSFLPRVDGRSWIASMFGFHPVCVGRRQDSSIPCSLPVSANSPAPQRHSVVAVGARCDRERDFNMQFAPGATLLLDPVRVQVAEDRVRASLVLAVDAADRQIARHVSCAMPRSVRTGPRNRQISFPPQARWSGVAK